MKSNQKERDEGLAPGPRSDDSSMSAAAFDRAMRRALAVPAPPKGKKKKSKKGETAKRPVKG